MIDLREEMRALIRGRIDLVAQGREVILRRVLDQKCQGCWIGNDQGSHRPNCRYCKGEGYMFRENFVKMAFFRGMAPVYKPGEQGTGQYPGSDWGYADPDRATAYSEYTVFPDYERYTIQTHPAFDKLYELKVDTNGQTVHPVIRSAKWKVMNVVPVHGDNGRVECFEAVLGVVSPSCGRSATFPHRCRFPSSATCRTRINTGSNAASWLAEWYR